MASKTLLMYDSDLIPRVKQVSIRTQLASQVPFEVIGNFPTYECFQYLEANVHKTYVDIEEMTNSLMNRYPDYSRRKRNAFRLLVETGE